MKRNAYVFYLHRFGSRDCGFQIEQAELDALPEASLSMTPCGDPNMQEYLDFAMEHNQLQKPENWESASELYMKLKEMAQLWNDQKGRGFVVVEYCCLSEHNDYESVTHSLIVFKCEVN